MPTRKRASASRALMGGENSEITVQTKAVLFESAVFKGSNIRKTARTLRHMTDAAARFIKGVEPVNAQLALDRAIELVDELHAGRVVGNTIDVCAADLSVQEADIDVAHVNRLLALGPVRGRDGRMLKTIGIDSEPHGNRLLVHIPHFRTDIETALRLTRTSRKRSPASMGITTSSRHSCVATRLPARSTVPSR